MSICQYAMSHKFCEITGKIMFDHPFNSFNVLGHSSTWVSLKEREKKNDFLPYEEMIFFPLRFVQEKPALTYLGTPNSNLM